ncbi:MAG: mannose-1-phosphate guanylyltransferase/mannose-6-phosphate isomerase, partial [Bacillota bacterium]
MIYAVILAGGSGTRLWPLSREKFPKQYLPMPMAGKPDSPDQSKKEISLFRATFERVTRVVSPEKNLVVTHRDQAAEVRRQLDLAGLTEARILKEPAAKNTAPAIGLAACLLEKEAGPETVMAVLPADHLIPDWEAFAELLKEGEAAAKDYGLVTFGIKPGYPETGYGYICSGEKLNHSARRVERFVEKPDLETARRYLGEGNYLWNSGMFVFKVGPLLKEYKNFLPQMKAALEKIDYKSFENVEEIYADLEKISIDYGIMERSGKVSVIPTGIDWSDLGSWEAYYQAAPRDAQGNYLSGRVVDVGSENSLVIADSRLVGTAGLKNMVVVETADALLVCSRAKSQDVKKIVDRLTAENATEAKEHLTDQRPWGSYTSLERTGSYQVKRINVNPGSRLSLQSHRHRSENWIVVSGQALVTVNEEQFTVLSGQRAYIPAGARHRIENRGKEPLVFIEVQSGDYLGEDDIIRYEDDYGRSEEKSAGGEAFEEPQTGVLAQAQKRFAKWLNHPYLEEEMRQALEEMKDDPEAIRSHFGSELAFGTGGMREVIGPGYSRFNTYIVRRATQGLADYLNSLSEDAAPGDPEQKLGDSADPKASPGAAGEPRKVAIAYDTRRYSDRFAETAALVLAANGIKALLFPGVRPTPMLSFTTRELGCAAGIVITASHNPSQYNGYKVYGPDGGQAVSPLVDHLMDAIGKVDIFNDVRTVSKEKAREEGLLENIDAEMDRRYLARVRSLSLSEPQENLKIVFTPLHGTGEVYIPALLAEANFVELFPVEEQSKPDPNFSTVKTPNPEDPLALDMALKRAAKAEADLVLATDPDGDRVGTAVRDKSGEYVILNGNQVGA